MLTIFRKVLVITKTNYVNEEDKYVFNSYSNKYGNIYLVIPKQNKFKSYIYTSPIEDFKYSTLYYQFKRNRISTIMALIRRLTLGHNFNIEQSKDILEIIDQLEPAVQKHWNANN